ncbi:MAG: FeoA family protein [Dehalococcoidia bacterium]
MGEKKYLTVAQMKVGQSGQVTEIGGGRGMKRLEAMGMRPGKQITKLSGMFGRGPVTVQIGGGQLAIGFGMARKIIVEVK